MIQTLYFDELFDYFFVFMRLSAVLMLFPGIGEAFVPVRIRLLAAFTLTLVITPVVSDTLPSLELLSPEAIFYIIREIIFGLFIGVLARVMLSALQVTGTIIGMQTSLSGAALLNPTLGIQDTAIGTILMFGAIALMFATNTHYLLIASIVSSYEIFPAAKSMLIGDFAQTTIQVFSKSFWLGVKLSFPIMIVGTLLNICTGLVNRLMPQMQVYFMFMPVQIFLGFLLLTFMITTIISIFMDHFREFLMRFANG